MVITATEFKEHLGYYIDNASKEEIVVTKNNNPTLTIQGFRKTPKLEKPVWQMTAEEVDQLPTSIRRDEMLRNCKVKPLHLEKLTDEERSWIRYEHLEKKHGPFSLPPEKQERYDNYKRKIKMLEKERDNA